jgi:uncharacterized protein
MRIHLDRIRRERRPFTWEETVEVAPQALGRDEVVALSPVRWRGRIVWADPGFFLTARLEVEQTLTCDRCLEPITTPAAEEVELLLLVDEPRQLEGERELKDEELGILHLDDEMLETEPLMIEALQLAVPMKPVCRPDCKGLCPHCGSDRNRVSCECEVVTVDPRWAALEKLKLGG